MIDKKLVAERFGRMSGTYDQYATVQKHMAHSLAQMVKDSGSFDSILEIGCGTGFFTRLLAEAYPKAHIVASDISPEMLSMAGSNLKDFRNISYVQEDGESLKIQGQFDLVISNAAFQWFNDYRKAFVGFYERLIPGGYLLYATLGDGTFQELHDSFKAARQFLGIRSDTRHGQSFVTMNILADIGRDIGFSGMHTEEEFREFFPTVRDFLISIKKIGANNANYGQDVAVSRQLMFSMMKYYEEHFVESGQVSATYHVIYGSARKP